MGTAAGDEVFVEPKEAADGALAELAMSVESVGAVDEKFGVGSRDPDEVTSVQAPSNANQPNTRR